MSETTQRTCFAIMPIRSRGSSEHAHFAAIYNQIRQVVTAEGFDVIRADEVTDEGAIAKDIITRLATAHLVVADLTDLNPNVFWELGVRHTLRAAGTALLLDETRTTEPPFDLGYLRIINYRGTVEGLSDLHDQLTQFVRNLNIDPSQVRSPVHEWIRHLPPDLSVPSSDVEATLRQEVSDHRVRLERYERKYGPIDDQDAVVVASPLDRIRRIQRLTNAGLLPAQMMSALRTATENKAVTPFIDHVAQTIENRVSIAVDDVLRISSYAMNLSLNEVSEAILNYGEELYPDDEQIQRGLLVKLSHGAPEERARARVTIANKLEFDLDTQEFTDQKSAKPDFALFGYLTDTLHADGLHTKAIAIAEAFNREYPGRAELLRVLGRAYEDAGDPLEGLRYFREAIAQRDVDDVSFLWLGNTMHNVGRHVDALEMYLLACWIDPEDGRFFAHCGTELSFLFGDPYSLRDPHSPLNADGEPRSLSPEIQEQATVAFVMATFSTRAAPADAIARCEDTLRRVEFRADPNDLVAHAEQMTRSQRRQLVYETYRAVASELSRDCPAHVKPTAIDGPLVRDSSDEAIAS